MPEHRRSPVAVEKMIATLLDVVHDPPAAVGGDPDGAEFHHGALASLYWLRDGGVAPFTGSVDPPPVLSRAVVRELSAVDAVLFDSSCAGRLYVHGVESAIMWMLLASATAPVWERALASPGAPPPDQISPA